MASATLWLEKEAKRLARRSAEIVKGAVKLPPPALSPALADNNPIKNDKMIPEVLEDGITMTKVTEERLKKVVMQIDPDEGTIRYNSGENLKKIIPIEAVKEIRTGDDTTYYRIQFKQPEEFHDRWVTVVYILDGNYKTLHVVADTKENAKLWTDALWKLHGIRQGLISGSLDFTARRTAWERQYFKGADKSGDHVLDFEEIRYLCQRLSTNLTTPELQRMFQEADVQKRGYLDYPDYQKFVTIIQLRRDVDDIYKQLSDLYGGKWDLKAFTRFMKECQMTRLSDREIKSVFDNYAKTSPNDQEATISSADFLSFLLSAQNAVLSDDGKAVCHDMTQPVSDYFISSSHNTYLVGNQLLGVSTIEGYVRAVLLSCRSVELDIYDGEVEPMIYHGGTLTSKVSLRDVCHALSQYAFRTSPYPVIISAEVHCSLAQQDKLVDIFIEIFKDSIVQAPVNGRPKIEQLPSPESLKHKFLLKAKNLYVAERLAAMQAELAVAKVPVALEADSSSSSSSDDEDDNKLLKEGLEDIKSTWKKLTEKSGTPKPPSKKMSFKLASLLVYTVGVKCHGFDTGVEYAPEHIFSLSETAANKHVRSNVNALIRHTHSHLVRVYPKGTRVNSSNYQPHNYWASGCQVVALNWQTVDLGYAMNQAMFQRNGRSGYVLKPEALRKTDSLDAIPKRTQHFLDVTIISAQQLPRLRDSVGKEIIDKGLVDPFVEVSVYVPEWFKLPIAQGQTPAASTSAGTTNNAPSARGITVRTSMVKNNGFNPMWRESFTIPFDCVGNMKELIFVDFVVRHVNGSLLGRYCVALSSLEQGYRHIPLHDSMLSQLLFSTLFVKITVRNI